MLFRSEGKMERKVGRRIGAAGAVLHSLYHTMITKRELIRKAKLSIYQSIFVPTLFYGHESWHVQLGGGLGEDPGLSGEIILHTGLGTPRDSTVRAG